MKTLFSNGKNNRLAFLCGAAGIAALVAGSFNTAEAQTINIGPNQYAFRFTVNPNYGLFFNATNTAYDFRNGTGAAVWSINADNGQLRNDLVFAPGFTYRVPAGNFAVRSATAPNAGIFFGAADFEFRIASGAPGWSMNAISGNSTFAGSISAPGGSSTQWNQAFGWGNHASAGYITTESDPKVGALTTNALPRWSGTQLVNSIASEFSNGIRIANSSNVLLRLNGTSAVNNPQLSFEREGAQIAWIQAFNTDLYVANQQNGNLFLRTNNIDRVQINNSGNIAMNTAPSVNSTLIASKGVGTSGAAIEGITTATSGDVRAIRGTSVTADGFGIGVQGTGGWRGVFGEAQGGNYTGIVYGVYGVASGGTVGTRAGVYGTAFGGASAWGGYFVGNTYVSGDLRLGTTTGATGYKLSVNGKIMCTEARVQAVANWPDYVFGEDYKLMSIEDLEQFVQSEKHLPGVPSAAEVEETQGFDLGEMQKITLEKIEELTLYLIEQNKLIKQQQQEIEWLKSQVKQ